VYVCIWYVCTCVYGTCARVYMVRVYVCIWYVCTCAYGTCIQVCIRAFADLFVLLLSQLPAQLNSFAVQVPAPSSFVPIPLMKTVWSVHSFVCTLWLLSCPVCFPRHMVCVTVNCFSTAIFTQAHCVIQFVAYPDVGGLFRL